MSIPIAVAAELLNTHVGSVRAMAARGDLAAEKIGGRWLVDEADAHRLAGAHLGPGRPLSARSAWGLLLRLSGIPIEGYSRSEAQRIRDRAARVDVLAPNALARRAEVHRFLAHPSILERIASDPRLVRGGAVALPPSPGSLVDASRLEGYVRAPDLDGMVDRFQLQPTPPSRANVWLRVPAVDWPFDDGDVAPPAVAAADLLDAGDERSVRLAREVLSHCASLFLDDDQPS